MGQGIVVYTGQFYAQSFLEKTCNIDFDQSKTAMLIAVLLASPFFLIFGSWSDRIGRKWIILGGMLLAVLSYSFLFGQLLAISGTEGRMEQNDQKEIRSNVAFIGKTRDLARTTSTYYHYQDGMQVVETKQDTVFSDGRISTKPMTTTSKTLNTGDYWKIIAILFILVLYSTMVNGPIAAFLVELFPTRIRYTSLSLPYHIGNGVFGGLTPFIAVLLTTIYPGNKLAGLWYPIVFTTACFVIGAVLLPGRKRAGHHVALEDI
jgi:MFS family permease